MRERPFKTPLIVFLIVREIESFIEWGKVLEINYTISIKILALLIWDQNILGWDF